MGDTVEDEPPLMSMLPRSAPCPLKTKVEGKLEEDSGLASHYHHFLASIGSSSRSVNQQVFSFLLLLSASWFPFPWRVSAAVRNLSIQGEFLIKSPLLLASCPGSIWSAQQQSHNCSRSLHFDPPAWDLLCLSVIFFW